MVQIHDLKDGREVRNAASLQICLAVAVGGKASAFYSSQVYIYRRIEWDALATWKRPPLSKSDKTV